MINLDVLVRHDHNHSDTLFNKVVSYLHLILHKNQDPVFSDKTCAVISVNTNYRPVLYCHLFNLFVQHFKEFNLRICTIPGEYWQGATRISI